MILKKLKERKKNNLNKERERKKKKKEVTQVALFEKQHYR